MLWILSPFVHTPPLPPPAGKVEVAFVRKEDMTPEGVWCTWEAESLFYDGTSIWAAAPPEEEHWCRTPFEASRTVDVLGQNGPFLSVRQSEWGCCPDAEIVTRCVTYDVRTGQPVTLAQYDPRSAKWRGKRLEKLLAKKDGGGWSAPPSAFVVDGAHVRICAERGDEAIEIPLR